MSKHQKDSKHMQAELEQKEMVIKDLSDVIKQKDEYLIKLEDELKGIQQAHEEELSKLAHIKDAEIDRLITEIESLQASIVILTKRLENAGPSEVVFKGSPKQGPKEGHKYVTTNNGRGLREVRI